MINTSIINFIAQFNQYGCGMKDAFSSPLGYWFAIILRTKFSDQSPEIVINVAKTRFGTAIRGRVYDISGDTTDSDRWLDYSGDET